MNRTAITRRRVLRDIGSICGSSLAAACLPAGILRAAEPASPYLNRFPRALHDAYVAVVRALMTARRDRLFALSSRGDAEAYVSEVRSKIAESFGPWPERTPLNPQVTGVVERDAYRIEKVIFESRPQFYVTANLYLPKKADGKIPGVVGSCGHSANGKAHEAYQSFAQGLARQGYACLIFDPIGQGERLQYVDENLKPKIGTGTSEHMMAGNQQSLVGEFFGAWRAWDGMRALDYLLSREEIDRNHVGITGNSGGGTMTTWLCGVERRWTMAAPSCFVTSFLSNLENELPADTEQCPPHALALGLDHADFIACMAPKPVVLLTQERDYFDVRGSQQAFEELRHIYKLLGAEENIRLFTGPGPHGYAQDAREAMYSCFNRATGVGESPAKEPMLTLEDDSTLQCTKRGQVAELKSRTVHSFTSERAATLAGRRGKLSKAELLECVKTLLPEAAAKEVGFRLSRPRSVKGHPLPTMSTFLVERSGATKNGAQLRIELPTIVYRWYDEANYSRPPRKSGPALLYIAHDSSDAELRSDPTVHDLYLDMKAEGLYACDVRGVGDGRPNTCGDNAHNSTYGSDYFYAAHGLMLGDSLVAQRIRDVLCAIDFVVEHGGHRKIHLVAKGHAAIPACLAALLRDEVDRVSLKHALQLYDALAECEIYAWPVSALLPGVLELFDLRDVYAALDSRHINLIDSLQPDQKVPAGG